MVIAGEQQQNMKFLVAVDKSDSSMDIVSYLLTRAKSHDHILLVHVGIFLLEVLTDGGKHQIKEEHAKLIREANERLDKHLLSTLAKLVAMAGIPVTTFHGHGEPGQIICSHAVLASVDTVVIGDETELDCCTRTMVGSISYYVVHHSLCGAVLIVKRGFKLARPRTILYCWDRSPASLSALEVVMAMANLNDRIICLHAYNPKVGPPSEDSLFSERLGQSLAPLCTQDSEEHELSLQNYLQRSSLKNIKIEVVMKPGDPCEVICQMAHTEKADIVAIGDNRKGLVSRWFQGSVSRHILRNARCNAVLIATARPH